MCRSMVDIQSATAEIRRGKKEERRTNHSMKIYMVSLLHRATITKAIVDYTSPAMCTAVTRFSPTGDAAYRQRTGGGPSHGHSQHAQKFGKDGAWGSGDILSDRQTDKHTNRRTHDNTSHPLSLAKQLVRLSVIDIVIGD